LNNSTTITSLDALASRYPAPRTSSHKKVHRFLTDPMKNWLQHSPFFILSSVTASGIDCSPRGDRPGEAFRVLDNQTIAIPDRRGNNRIDTLKNILADPRIGLVFLIPGVAEALRIKGVASISINPELLDTFRLDGDPPATVILVSVEHAYVQNARATRAADLWNAESYLQSSQVPNATELYDS
jgi:PPOX class probable FMN-dependent enzyme